MSPRFSDHERTAIATDLLEVIAAGRLDQLAALRLRILRENAGATMPASPWVSVEADRIAKTAAKLIGGQPEEWLDAAFAALGRLSREALCIEVVREVAEQVRAEREPDPRQSPERDPEPDRRQQAAWAAPRVTLGRKRGKR